MVGRSYGARSTNLTAVIIDQDADLKMALQALLFAAIGTAYVLASQAFATDEQWPTMHHYPPPVPTQVDRSKVPRHAPSLL